MEGTHDGNETSSDRIMCRFIDESIQLLTIYEFIIAHTVSAFGVSKKRRSIFIEGSLS